MKHVINALKFATRYDQDELKYYDSQIEKTKSKILELQYDLEQTIKKREEFIEGFKEIEEFIKLNDIENN